MKSLLFCILFSLITSVQAFSSPRLLDNNFHSGNSCVSNLRKLNLETTDFLNNADYTDDSLHNWNILYLKTKELSYKYKSVELEGCPKNSREIIHEIIASLLYSSKSVSKIIEIETIVKKLPKTARDRAMEASDYDLFLNNYIVHYLNADNAIQRLEILINRHPEKSSDTEL